jgi:hypothetical protein
MRRRKVQNEIHCAAAINSKSKIPERHVIELDPSRFGASHEKSRVE